MEQREANGHDTSLAAQEAEFRALFRCKTLKLLKEVWSAEAFGNVPVSHAEGRITVVVNLPEPSIYGLY